MRRAPVVLRALDRSELPRRRRSRWLGVALGVLLLAAIDLVALAHVRADGALDELADPGRYVPTSRGVLRGWQVDLVVAYFPPDQIPTALAVMACESGGRAGATGYLGEQGLMQLRPEYHQWRTWKLFGEWRSLYDPEVNVAVAADLWQEAGWGPWSCAR